MPFSIEMRTMTDQLPLYFKGWWLDALAGKHKWGVARYSLPGYATAYWPWVLKEKPLSIQKLSQPPLTQFLGPYIDYSDKNQIHTRSISNDLELYKQLYALLPAHHIFQQNFSPDITNWLPFYWNGFIQTTKYTYKLDTSSPESQLWSNVQNEQRRTIRKAIKHGMICTYSSDPSDLYRLHQMTFHRQGISSKINPILLSNLCKALQEQSSGHIIYIKNKDGYTCSSLLLAWDSKISYYICGGTDPHYRSSGAGSLALWSAILYSQSQGKVFDFEGSMRQPIEKFFRSFGAKQHAYHNLKRYNSNFALKVDQFKQLIR